MENEADERSGDCVAADGEFAVLLARRRRLGVAVVLAMVVVYFGDLLLLIAAPGLMRTRVTAHITLGFPLGVAVLLVTVLLVLLHVGRSAAAIDPVRARIVARHRT